MRIATLLPSATEIVSALGLREALVAVSHECDYPQGVADLPPITSSILQHHLSPSQIDDAVVQAVRDGQALYQVDGDLLAELQPDVIITQGVCDVCAVNQGTVQETLVFLPDAIAEKVQIVTLSGSSFSGILRDVQLVGAATGMQDEAKELTDSAEAAWQALAKTAQEDKPSVAMLEWPDPYFFGGHWVPEMVDVAGGRDVFGQAGLDSGRFTAEEILQKDPDILISMACGYGLEKNIEFARMISTSPELSSLRAIQNQNVWAMDANSYCSRPTPRVVDGARMLQAIFSGQGDGIDGVLRVHPD